MQENSVYNFKNTKKAGIVNFVSVALLALLVLAFFACLYTGVIGSGVDNSDGKNEGVGFALLLVVFLPFIIFGLALLALTSVYKIIFGSILLKACSVAKAGQETKVANGLFVASVVLRVVSVLLLLATGWLVASVIDAGGTPILTIVFGLIFVGLAVFEVIGFFVEKKAKREHIDAQFCDMEQINF